MADRDLLQMDKAESQSQSFSRHISQRRHDPVMDCPLRLPITFVYQIQSRDRLDHLS